MHPSGAFRNDFRTHVDDEIVGMQEEDRKTRQEIENREVRELVSLASLNDHPGFARIRAQLESTIADYRSGAKLRAAMLDADITNAKLGELTRTTMLVADELQAMLVNVDAAVLALAQEKDSIREQRPKPRGN